jgi:ribosomal protein L27
MKNKIVTALAGSLFGLGLTSASVAQTTISGNLDLAYHAVSSNATGGSYRAVGRETQINIANKGKLSNGMDYAAGFSWELDGGEQLGVSTSADSDSANSSNENVYIDFFYNKDSYVSISNDHVPNTDVTFTNLVGWGYLGGQGIGSKTSLYPTSLNTSGYGIGVSHNFGPMRLSGTFVPNPNKDGAPVNETGHTLTSVADTNTNSKVELTARGDLGVKGLDLMLGVSKIDKVSAGSAIDATAQDPKGRRASIKYNAGQITIAGDYIRTEGNNITSGAAVATTTADHELTGKSVGIAYAINKDLSVGYTRSKAETSKAGYADEKVNHFAIGYNLGAVTAQIQYRDAEGVVGATGAEGEGEILAVKLSTRF